MVATVSPLDKKEPLPSTPPKIDGKTILVAPKPLAPINSGPTQYYANGKAAAFFWIVLLAQIATRLACCIWIAAEDSIRKVSWFYCIISVTLYFLSFLNVWTYKMAHFRSYMTLSRYKKAILRRSYIPGFFLLDQLLFFFLPIALAYLGFFLWKLFFFGLLIILLNIIIFIIMTKYEVVEYSPMKGQEHLITSIQKEQIGMDNNQLKIIESRAVKITIANISDRPIQGNLLIVRKVALKETVIIPVSLAAALYPRVELTLIPETHILPGAFQMKNYRSFGIDKGLIETKIFTTSKENYSVRMVEKFQENETA